MNKLFKAYLIVWTILLAAYNAVVFLARPLVPGYTVVYDARFWIAWAFVVLAFAGNLACAFIASKSGNKEKMFLNLPLIKIGYTGLVLMLVFGAGLMLIPNCPSWIAAVVCVLIFAFNAVAAVSAKAAADVIEKQDVRIKEQTSFIKGLTARAKTLMDSASTPEIKADCRKIYEAVRYSDPMSNDALADVDSRISAEFSVFAGAVSAENTDAAKAACNELLKLITERNNTAGLNK